MTSFKRIRLSALIAIGSLMATLLAVRTLHAGSVYVALIIDPPTTAFAGIPASGGFNGISNRSGPGTWHLFVIDDVDNTFGIRLLAINLLPGPGGTIPNISNRLPMTAWDDDPSFGSGSGPFYAGFTSDRSGNDMSLVTGFQTAGADQPLITGFSQTASDFQAKTGGQSFSGTVNGQWGQYADFPAVNFPNGIRYPLFVAEGTYTGSPPSIDTRHFFTVGSTVSVWTDASLTTIKSFDVFLFVPEPSATPIIGLAVGALLCWMRRRRQASAA